MEEDEGANFLTADFSELLDLPDTAFTGSNDILAGSTVAAEPTRPTYPAHPDISNCLCDGSMGDWDLPEPSADPYVGLEEPDYGKFENWIPQFVRPEKPCDYCRIRRLNCYITRGETACTPCNALFRECSLTNTSTLTAANQGTNYLLDTLHAVDEDAIKEQGTAVGIKPLRSKAGSSLNVRLDDAPGSSKRNGIRFPRQAVKVLRDWLDAHSDNPYPTEEEKAELEKRTELKPSQIANWLANARRRRKVTEKARPKFSTSPSLKPATPAITIPCPDQPWDELNPLERWKHSPPEHEPASITDIANAVANSDLPDDQISTSPSSLGRRKHRSSAGSGFSNARAPSTTSFEETGQSSSLSASTSAAYSQHSSHSQGSFGSFSSGLAGKKDRRRRRRPAQTTLRKPGDEKKRIFQCTFCTDTFKSKYDWTRHEKSLHLSLEKWICAPLGPVITDPVSGKKRCVYCDEQNSSDDHLETHNHRQCEEKGMDARTFFRKDHLRQHLRLMHNCEMTPFMDNWKSIAVNINSRCGFCAKRFTVWQERVDHLTAHFKAGARMSEWKGCRGLDPAVAAQVTNAMPPYLIGYESTTPNPFSALNKGTWEQNLSAELGIVAPDLGNFVGRDFQDQEVPAQDKTGLPAKATCWEILTVRLGRYANEMAAKGVVLTDEMLQSAARLILYESDDPWHNTAADNPEWLDLFKKAHGLDFIPTAVGGQGENVPEDLETYGDLGLRIPFSVQLQAYNQSQGPTEGDVCQCKMIPTQHLQCHHKQKLAELNRVCMTLSKEGVLHDANGECKHTECDDNVFDASAVDGSSAVGPRQYRWCTYELPPQKAKEIAALTKPIEGNALRGPAKKMAQDPQRSSNISQGMESLHKLSLNYDGDSHWLPNDSKITATQARAQCFNGECVEPDPTGVNGKKPYLQRHRYELPKNRAQRFATTTGAWQDSGTMPEPVTTSAPSVDLQDTSTGAMMEFLGGDIGKNLPFSSDAQTSRIPLDPDFSWAVPTTAAEEAAMIHDVDQLIAETTAAQSQQPTTANSFSDATTSGDLPTDFGMDVFDFDMDMDFDEGAFDMPMDETFGQASES